LNDETADRGDVDDVAMVRPLSQGRRERVRPQAKFSDFHDFHIFISEK
jgi:hypothetical protein